MGEKKVSLKYYRQVLKEKGVKGFTEEFGWKIAILVFMFFLLKGLVWLFIFYGGFELIKKLFN